MNTTDPTTPTALSASLNIAGAGLYPAAGKQIDIGGTPHVFVPDNTSLVDMEKSLAAPKRIRAKLQVRELESFLSYLNDYILADSAIFAKVDPNGLTATCIIDYPPGNDKTAWGDHRITLTTAHSREWLRWMKHNKADFTQQQFAEWIEDNARMFMEPAAGDMLSIAQDMELRSNVEWKGSVRLDSGDTSLAFVSTTKAGAGNIELPKTFKIAIPVFQGGMPYQLEARLRPRLDEGKLVIKYELIQTDVLVEKVLKEIVEKITEKTGITPLMGETPDRV